MLSSPSPCRLHKNDEIDNVLSKTLGNSDDCMKWVQTYRIDVVSVCVTTNMFKFSLNKYNMTAWEIQLPLAMKQRLKKVSEGNIPMNEVSQSCL